jgi:hypothetical protein
MCCVASTSISCPSAHLSPHHDAASHHLPASDQLPLPPPRLRQATKGSAARIQEDAGHVGLAQATAPCRSPPLSTIAAAPQHRGLRTPPPASPALPAPPTRRLRNVLTCPMRSHAPCTHTPHALTCPMRCALCAVRRQPRTPPTRSAHPCPRARRALARDAPATIMDNVCSFKKSIYMLHKQLRRGAEA